MSRPASRSSYAPRSPSTPPGPGSTPAAPTCGPGRPPLLRLTKGVHLVTPRGTRQANVLFAGTRRPALLRRALARATRWSAPPTPTTRATRRSRRRREQDVDYLVGEAKRAFPGGPFDQVYYTWAGVRALVREDHVAEGEVSRKHAVLDHERDGGLAGHHLRARRQAHRRIEALPNRSATWSPSKLGRQAPGYSSRRSLPGGRLSSVEAYLRDELRPWALQLGLDDDHGDASRSGLWLARGRRAAG